MTTFVSLPLISVLVPLSILCHLLGPHARQFTPLPLHPDTLPPHRSLLSSLSRGYLIYGLGAILWALTCSGNAPEYNPRLSRRITRWACQLARRVARHTDPGELDVQETKLAPFPDELCTGVLGLSGLRKEPVVGFWLRHLSKRKPANPRQYRRDHRQTVLFLAGGGYVTSFPLVHPIIFSFILSYPPDQAPLVLAPDVRKALDMDRSFPVPLLDALAGYLELRRVGFEPEDIVVLGDSAGAGLAWSLISYLAVMSGSEEPDRAALGVPSRVVLISPWLSLPPHPTPFFPDIVDEPMLLGAARCYLARFPIIKHRPDPFVSDLRIWANAVDQHARRYFDALSRMLHANGWPLLPRPKRQYSITEEMAAKQLDPKPLWQVPSTLRGWLEPSAFAQLSSHHPLVSPCTDTKSPFVRGVLDVLAENKTKMYVQAGTAEWFYPAGASMARAAKEAGIDVVWQEELGGCHVEACVTPAELGGAPARLLKGLRRWLDA